MWKTLALMLLAAGVIAGTLFAQTPVLTISGTDKPEVSTDSVVLRPPDYTFDVECKGGPWRFRISGAPDFAPAPTLRPDNWFDCADILHVHIIAAAQPVELTVSSAREDSQAGVSAVVKIVSAEPPPQQVPQKYATRFTQAIAIFCGALGLLAGFAALWIAWRCYLATKTAERSAQGLLEGQEKTALRLKDLSGRIQHLEAWQQGLQFASAEIASLRNSLDTVLARLQALTVAAQTQPFSGAPGTGQEAGTLPSPAAPPAQARDQAGATALCEAVAAWRARAEKEHAELPSQLYAKLDEMRRLGASDSAGLTRPQTLQWRDLAFSIVSLVADHTDQHLDPHRTDGEWQAMLKRIFQAAGAEEIYPPHNAPVNEAEHYAVGTMPQQSPGDLPDHVARLRQRGFRMQGDLVRKAAVVVYQ